MYSENNFLKFVSNTKEKVNPRKSSSTKNLAELDLDFLSEQEIYAEEELLYEFDLLQVLVNYKKGTSSVFYHGVYFDFANRITESCSILTLKTQSGVHFDYNIVDILSEALVEITPKYDVEKRTNYKEIRIGI